MAQVVLDLVAAAVVEEEETEGAVARAEVDLGLVAAVVRAQG